MQTKYRQAVFSYSKSGHGSQVLLLFHGFGQDHSAFHELCTAVGDKYTCYSFDLFFHGNSEWSYGEEPLRKEFLKELLEQFLTENQIQHFSVLGFSIGSRFALACLAEFPSRVKNIYLLAPDSIQPNFWYQLATATLLGRALFRFVIFNPRSWIKVASIAEKTNLADPQVVRFASHQLSTEYKRKQVYLTWIVFRKLKFDMRTVSQLITSNQINFTVLIGSRDKLIAMDAVQKLEKHLKGFKAIILKCSHTGLINSSIEYIRKN